jgi:hypothetical protein
MHKVSRSLLLAGVLAFGTLTAACGDKVEIIQPTTQTGVTAITVTPAQATIAAGSTIQLASSVVADANTAKTVSWTTSASTVATVDATGKVTGVGAGTATIIATSTADATKAAAAVITVTGGPSNTPNTVAISTITQGGTLFPANLANVAGQVDVTLFVSGPGGTLNLIQNCTANGATSTTGDVIVAQQVIAGSQNQSPVTLSYNTAATGTVTNGVAVVNPQSSTPIALNGNCVLKAQLGTAVATNITPFTLNNANVFRATTTFTKTTTLGTQNAISATNGLRYDQGDLTVAVTPVVYTTVAPGGAAQTPALASISYAGRTFTNVAFTNGRFSVTFPSTGATAQNIYQYTSPAAGDAVTITGYSDVVGQPITIGVATPVVGLRSDNQSPTVNAGALAQVLNLTGAPRNYINAAYAFAANNTAQTDAAFANSQNTVSFYVGAVPAGAVYPTAQSANFGAAACSTTGLTKVAAGADIAQTAAPYTPNYFVRVIENDPLGNVVCQDFGPFGVDKQNPNAITVTGGPANNTVVVTGATNTFFSVDSVSGFTPNAELRTTVVRNFTTNSAASCVIGTFANSTCNATATGFNVVVDNNTGTQGYYVLNTVAQDQAGNVSPTMTRVYLLDNTAPTVGGISIPQTLVGGSSVTFTSQANDNVDLQASNFDITYSAASGGYSLFYTGDNYGPNYDATRVTSAPLNATVPFFIKQLQNTAGGAPVAFAAGVGADSGRATTVTVRAIDAANLISANSFAAIPAINISNSTGFTTEFTTFSVSSVRNDGTAAGVSVTNGTGTGTTKATTLTASAILNSATAQQANLPFSQVCFFYQQTAAGNAANPQIPTGDLVSLGCVSSPDIADVANVSRTWTYRLAGFDPPAALGTAGTINIFAVGVNAAGVGIISGPNANITLIN